MEERQVLMYLPSNEIVDFCRQHEIDWLDRYKALAKRGGIGDRAGVPPTPAVGEFLNCLLSKKSLFTQQEYMGWCSTAWREWKETLPLEKWKGVVTKLYRNFYPAMIDQLHVWALLSETKKFSLCYLDSFEDAIGKSDLTVQTKNGERFHIALSIATRQAQQDLRFKHSHRHDDDSIETINIALTLDRPKKPGNKRWYSLEDFTSLFEIMNVECENEIVPVQYSSDINVKQYFDDRFTVLENKLELILKNIDGGKQTLLNQN